MTQHLAQVQTSYEVQLNENKAIKEVIQNLENKYLRTNDEKERYLEEIMKMKTQQGEKLNQINEMQRELNLQKESLSSEKKKLMESQLLFEQSMKAKSQKRSLSQEGSDFGPRGEKLLTENQKRISAPVDFADFELIDNVTELKNAKNRNTLA